MNLLPSTLSPRALSCAPCLLAVLLWLGGCDSCGKEPKVPFKLGGESATDAGLLLEPTLDAESRAFSSAVDRPSVDGAELPLDFVRTLLAHDLDGDGDRDVLALVHDTARRLRLTVSMREGAGYQAASDVQSFVAPGDESCVVREASLSFLAKDKALLTIALGCGDPQLAQPPSLTLVSLEASPRVVERFEVLGSEESAAVTLRAEAADSDGDGQADFQLLIEARAETRGGDALKLAWLDRAGGLSRDVREPEASFAAWASAAQGELAKNPGHAAQIAQQVLFYERVLCREEGRAQLLVSGAVGVPCGASKAASSALATLTLAHAKLRELPAALYAYAELSRRDVKPDKRTQERLASALAALPRQEGITLRQGPPVEPSARPRILLPSARFIDDDHLLLRRAIPVIYDLTSSTESAPPQPSDDLMRDPSGALLVSDIERDGCGVPHLRIERAPAPLTPYVPGALVSAPALLPTAGRPACKQPVGKARADSGFSILGWAPQGVVAARDAEVVVVPLDLRGAPAAEPFALPEHAPLPAPLPSGASSPDGARYAALSAAGVLVFDRARDAPELWRPDGYSAIAGTAREVAISPSGRRVAVVAAGVVYVLSR